MGIARSSFTEVAMEVFNAASKAVALRAFAGGLFTDVNKPVIIFPGEQARVYGPPLRELGFMGPYIMPGSALVRDWGPLQIVPTDDMFEITLRPQERGVYKRHFQLNPQKYEGFVVAFSDEYHLIDGL